MDKRKAASASDGMHSSMGARASLTRLPRDAPPCDTASEVGTAQAASAASPHDHTVVIRKKTEQQSFPHTVHQRTQLPFRREGKRSKISATNTAQSTHEPEAPQPGPSYRGSRSCGDDAWRHLDTALCMQ